MTPLQRYMSRPDVLAEFVVAGIERFPDDDDMACLWAAAMYRAYLAGDEGGEA